MARVDSRKVVGGVVYLENGEPWRMGRVPDITFGSPELGESRFFVTFVEPDVDEGVGFLITPLYGDDCNASILLHTTFYQRVVLYFMGPSGKVGGKTFCSHIPGYIDRLWKESI